MRVVKNKIIFYGQPKCAFFVDAFCFVWQVDPFHTLFGLAGLSLLGSSEVKPVNPVYCLPEETIESLKVRPELLG